ncbi:MAG: hypothetical protein IJ761_03285 [Bacteroidales bacterium]|nr:hypothetical protein [Bacteroidales bacterium]
MQLKSILAIGVIQLCSLTVLAQTQPQNTYNENVVVQGHYRPELEQQQKLYFPVRINDTAAKASHHYTYTIQPTRLKALYEPTRIKAARVIGEPATRLYNNYFRVGFGNYFSPLFDAYFSSTRDKKKTYGASINHLSSWGTLPDYGKNHFGQTNVTLFGKYIIKEKLQLHSDLSYLHDHNLYYGFTDSTLLATLVKQRDDISTTDYTASYNTATWNIGLQNMQLDERKLGYAANVKLSDLWAGYGQNEFNLTLTADVRYGFNIKNKYDGVAYLHTEWDGFLQRFNAPDAASMPLGFSPTAITDTTRSSKNIVKINPYADFTSNGLQFHVGFTAAWDGFSQQTVFRFFPDVVVTKKIFNDLIAIDLGATGSIESNSIASVSAINPYLSPGAQFEATRHYDFLSHLRWNISRKLEARAEVGYSLVQNDLTFATDTNYLLGNVFSPTFFDNNRFNVGASVDFVNDEILHLQAGGHWYHYALADDNALLCYRPTWDAHLTAQANYHDRWLLTLEGRLLSKMTDDHGDDMPMRYGINAEVEYRHNKAISFFVKMNNLAFQRYYLWRNYPSQRGLFLVGLTYTLN